MSNKEKTDAEQWAKTFLAVVLAFLMLVSLFVFVVDPYFHYRKPLPHINYELKYSNYINNGMLRHFDYDAVIIGTSMCQNFKPSEMNDLFLVNSIKTCFQGGSYATIDYNLKKAFEYNDNIRVVVRGLDYNKIDNKDISDFSDDMPWYLYDENPFNDVEYLLNFETIMNMRGTLTNTFKSQFKGGMTSLDDYDNWSDASVYGIEAVREYQLKVNAEEKTIVSMNLSKDDKERIRDNIYNNVVSTAQEHPETTFYYFFTPYSIFYWDDLNSKGLLDRQIEIERIAIEEILKSDNIELYSFNYNEEIITNLDNYKDSGHYGGWINSLILKTLQDGSYDFRITKDNYEQYLKDEKVFFENYDYRWLWR